MSGLTVKCYQSQNTLGAKWIADSRFPYVCCSDRRDRTPHRGSRACNFTSYSITSTTRS